MERLNTPRKKGMSRQQLLFWGILFLVAGMISRSILQNRVLQIGSLNGQQLFALMTDSGAAVAAATVALVLQALETCAVPVFAFLLVDGYEKANSRKKMLLFLLLMAVVSEIPYNYAMYGKLLHMTARSPAVSMVLAMAILYFFHRYSENSFANVLIKTFVALAALLWAIMLNVDHGVPLLIVTMVMYALRKQKQMLTLFGAAASAICAMISPFYIVSPMGILPVHLCREEEPTDGNLLPYLIYPALLLAVGVLAGFVS